MWSFASHGPESEEHDAADEDTDADDRLCEQSEAFLVILGTLDPA